MTTAQQLLALWIIIGLLILSFHLRSALRETTTLDRAGRSIAGICLGLLWPLLAAWTLAVMVGMSSAVSWRAVVARMGGPR